MKIKVAISIDESLLKIIDRKVDGAILRSRSQAIEYFAKKGLKEDPIKTAVILLKGSQQKVALSKYNGKPLIRNQIDFFIEKGIQKIYLLTQKPSEELIDEIENTPIEIIHADKANGNASALLYLKDKIKNSFIVMSGDTYNNFDLEKMIRKHLSLHKIATMGLMTREELAGYGIAILDGDFIVDFRENIKSSSSHIVNAGIYIFKPEIFELMHGNSLEKDIFPKLAKLNELAGFFTYGEYEHLHTKS